MNENTKDNFKGIGFLPMFSDLKVYKGIKYIAGREGKRLMPLVTEMVKSYTRERFNTELDVLHIDECFKQLKDMNDKAKTGSVFDYIEYCCSKYIDDYLVKEIEALKPKKRG